MIAFVVVAFVVATLSFTFYAVSRASPGYEDAGGFHYGERCLPKPRTRARPKRSRSSK